MKRRQLSAVAAAAVTVFALVSAWHSGRHMWHLLGAERRTYAAYSAADRRHSPLTQLELPGDVFDWYATYLLRGDRAYYQVLQSGFSHDLDLPSAFGYAARFYLLPAVEATDLRRATVVVSFHADPALLPTSYLTQRRSGLQPIFVSRIRVP